MEGCSFNSDLSNYLLGWRVVSVWPQFPWGSLIPVGVLSAFVSVALGETLDVYFRPHSPRVGIDVFLDLESAKLSRSRRFLLLEVQV